MCGDHSADLAKEGVAERGHSTACPKNQHPHGGDRHQPGGRPVGTRSGNGASAGKPCREDHGCEQQQGVDEVDSHDHCAADGVVVGGHLQQNDGSPDEGLDDHEPKGCTGGPSDGRATGPDTERPDEQDDREEERTAAGHPMGELDEGLHRGGARHDLSVAGGPVVAASSTGAGGADKCAPQDHEQVVAHVEPSEAREAGAADEQVRRWAGRSRHGASEGGG